MTEEVVIKVSSPRQLGTWKEKPLYEGYLTGHPNKQDGVWPFVISKEEKGKKYMSHYNHVGHFSYLEVQFI